MPCPLPLRVVPSPALLTAGDLNSQDAMEVKHFGSEHSIVDIPSLTEIQTKSYEDFLQADVPFNRRANIGLEAILRETFPIFSYDKTMSLEYIGYELGRPRYTSDECRVLGQ